MNDKAFLCLMMIAVLYCKETILLGATTLALDPDASARVHVQTQQHEYFFQLQKIRQTYKGNDVILFPTSLFAWQLEKQSNDSCTMTSHSAMPTGANATLVDMLVGVHWSKNPFQLSVTLDAQQVRWYDMANALHMCFKMAERTRAGNLMPLKVIHSDDERFYLGTSFSLFGKVTLSYNQQAVVHKQEDVYSAPTNPEMHQSSSYFTILKQNAKQQYASTFDEHGYPITCFLFDK